MRTIKELAQEALAVQDASNLSGVVLSFGVAIVDLKRFLEKEDGFSTQQVNEHPICKLWADKIASLTGVQGDRDWTLVAYNIVNGMAKDDESTPLEDLFNAAAEFGVNLEWVRRNLERYFRKSSGERHLRAVA